MCVLKDKIADAKGVSVLFYKHINRVQKRQIKGSKFGLERTAELLKRLGNPQNALKIVHVAGTNGKGSTCQYITCALVQDGKKVGTFTSPEVYSYAEKYQVGAKTLPLKKIDEYLKRTVEIADQMDDKPTAFEIETATAFYIFANEGCEYAVIECGMGGLLDSTNAIDEKELAIITSISLEHVNFLGDTVQKICAHKSGIIKNCPAIICRLQTDGVLDFFGDKVCTLAKPFTDEKASFEGWTFRCDGDDYKIKMHGRAQLFNACTAITACKTLGISQTAIKKGLEKATLKGRIERVCADKQYYLDGGHNPDGVLPLVDFVDSLNAQNPTLIYGCLSDKDVDGCAKNLAKTFGDVIIVSPKSYRAMPVEQIFNTYKKYFNNVRLATNERQAIDMAQGETVVICGSFTLLKECKKWIEKRR